MKRSAAGLHKRVRRTSLTLAEDTATAPSLPAMSSGAGLRASAALSKMPKLSSTTPVAASTNTLGRYAYELCFSLQQRG